MADAINTGNPVPFTKFFYNKYDDIDGSRVSQQTERGRLCFRDTNGRMTLPRSAAEAAKAVYPVDWAEPLNPPPYFEGPGLNGQIPNALNDGSLDNQENDFDIAYLNNFTAGGWPVAYKQFDIPLKAYDLPVVSGNKCLVFDRGTFTYGSGNYIGVINNYTIGQAVYAAFDSGNEGKLTFASSGTTVVGFVTQRETFGAGTLTVKLKGTVALS
jgi:hypothetical protein